MEALASEDPIRRLVDDYRTRCLWFLREDYYPTTAAERERVLRLIEQYGDLKAFRRVAELRTWRSRRFTGSPIALAEALAADGVVFHPGRLGGALPQLKSYRSQRSRASAGCRRSCRRTRRAPKRHPLWQGAQGGSLSLAPAQFVARRRPKGRWPSARCITSYCTPMMWPMASIQ